MSPAIHLIFKDEKSTESMNRFNYRVSGLLERSGKILIHKKAGDDFWTLPGGKCELLEESQIALKREFSEELKTEITVQRILWIVENFFEFKETKIHEINFIFLIDDNNKIPFEEFSVNEGDNTFIFKLEKIENLNAIIKPAFLQQAIRNIPIAPVHVIEKMII